MCVYVCVCVSVRVCVCETGRVVFRAHSGGGVLASGVGQQLVAQCVLSAVRVMFPCCCPAGWHRVGQLQPTVLLPGGVKAAVARRGTGGWEWGFACLKAVLCCTAGLPPLVSSQFPRDDKLTVQLTG